MDEDFYTRQRQLLFDVLRDQDVVITTASFPAAKPRAHHRRMIHAMQPARS